MGGLCGWVGNKRILVTKGVDDVIERDRVRVTSVMKKTSVTKGFC